MNIFSPSPTVIIINGLLQMLVLAFLAVGLTRNLCRNYRHGVAITVLITGLIAGILLGFILLLSTDNDFYETWCSRCNHLGLGDIFWVAVIYIDKNLLIASGLGMILAWLSARFWIRDIRADKTTVFVAGIILGLILGVIVEVVHIRGGRVSSIDLARFVLFAFLGGILALMGALVLFRNGRFQFGIKDLLAVTAIWALILGSFYPQFSRYQEEEKTLVSLATLLGQPIQCTRRTGWIGLPHVNYIYLPLCTIADDQIDTVISACKRFPDLVGMDVSSTTISDSGLQRLKEALPDVKFEKFYLSSGFPYLKEGVLPASVKNL
jgi:hypothetical protein